MKGIYVILAKLTEPTRLETKSRRRFIIETGFYAYVGSALGGLEKRVFRHLNVQKKHHWHIDYLLDHATIKKIICAETNKKKECSIAQAFSQGLTGVPGFGCSDCRCPSHLFFSGK